MTCNQFRELISARLDGEVSPEEETVVDAHLATCVACSDYQERAFALRRSLRVTVAPTADSEPTKLRAIPAVGSASLLQWVLFVVGITLIALNVSAVVFVDSGAQAHVGRHEGVFGTAVGIAMLAVALKPQRAIGLVPLTSTIALLMIIVAVVDLAASRASLWNEAIHLVEFAGLGCLWIISGGPARLHGRLESSLAVLRASTIRH